MFSLPFARSTSRATQPSTSRDDFASPSDEFKKGSWVLAQDRPAVRQDDLTPELTTLNECLELVAEIFPDVQAEVFREMLLNVSMESRAEIVTEHLLKDKGKWVRGRYKTLGKDNTAKDNSNRQSNVVPYEATFRSEAYRQAVKSALYMEFKGLSHATIKAVLAEHNSSYTNSRPVLRQLSSKSWRYYLSNMWSKKADINSSINHPLINWQTPYGDDGPRIPYLRQTDSNELNAELYETYIAPARQREETRRLQQDAALALELNQAEATKYEALFECQCCYSSMVFEETAVCSTGYHMVCFQCVRFALNEALYGQGWAKTVDVDRMALHCLASTGDGCQAFLYPELIKRVVSAAGSDGDATYRQFTDRVAQHNLDRCGMPVLRCPFCSYAEVDETPEFEMASLARIYNRLCGLSKGGGTGLVQFFAPLIAILLFPLLVLAVQLARATCTDSFATAHKRALRRRQGLRFQCLSLDCQAASCSICQVRWQDPHICYETAKDSLRHAIEAATTAVVKRTCPRCNTSFVKSTGCNKLVCPCGYSMCYICRSPIGQEGYAHFCQHFRVSGGRCRECNRCDLYKVEDEDSIIKRAAEQADRDWRVKQGEPEGDSHLRDQVLRWGTASGGFGTSIDDTMDLFVGFTLA